MSVNPSITSRRLPLVPAARYGVGERGFRVPPHGYLEGLEFRLGELVPNMNAGRPIEVVVALSVAPAPALSGFAVVHDVEATSADPIDLLRHAMALGGDLHTAGACPTCDAIRGLL
jgi:hypothetical protein